MARKDDVIDTGIPGIKQRKSDKKYLVTLDLGRQKKVDKKTGEVKLRQVKTTRVVPTLKEAKALLGENNKIKRHNKVSGIAGKIRFDEAIEEYMEFFKDDWGISHAERQKSYKRRLVAFFGETDVREIDALDIEMFFRWCREKQGSFRPISNNTIQKIKSMLNQFYKYMKKSPNRYGVTVNPVEDTELGDIEEFEATVLKIEQINDMLKYILDNEKDTAFFVLWGLAYFCGMRRGEICGLKWKDIHWDTNRIYLVRQRIEVPKNIDEKGWIEKVPKRGKDNGNTPQKRRERWIALPTKMQDLLLMAKKQQETYSRREVKDEDYVLRSKPNLVNDYITTPRKWDTHFKELQARYNRVLKKAGKETIPEYRLHDLRHSNISHCLNGGVNPFQVAASSGHKMKKNLGQTFSTYWHDNGDRAEMVEFIDNLITVPIEVLDIDDELFTPRERTTNRPDLRSDDI